jgi:SAM-dependent methyltransferase
MASPLRVYGAGLTTPGAEVLVCFSDGSLTRLPLTTYLGPADRTDELLMRTITGPVLDVGCGPGRHLHALAKRGVFALGVDLSPAAVSVARDRGANAIVGSIFDEVPGAGTWRTALLLDGNIGIGGSPARLLRRLWALLQTSGEVLVELDPPNGETRMLTARLQTATATSGWFPWARVAAADIEGVARAGGFRVRAMGQDAQRWFARLRKR